MSDKVVTRLIGALEKEKADIAEAAMLQPKHELFALGEVAGRYQGLHKALEILSNILSSDEDEEKRS